MSFGGGATLAAARVVLGVDSAQFSEGLRAAEVEFASTVGQMGGVTAELYERQLRASASTERLGATIKQYGAESVQATEATAALVREQRRLADVALENDVAQKRFGSGMRLNQSHVRGFGSALGFTTNALIGGAGFVYGVKVAVDAATRFQGEMRLLQTQALSTHQEVITQTRNVLHVAGQLATTPDMLSKGLYRVESAGIRGAHALNILKTAAMGARIGHADLEDTTNALVAAQKTGIAGAHNLAQAMGTLDAIVGAGNMRMQDLASALASGVVPAAKQFGLSLSQLGGALDVLTVQGVPAELAATRLRYTIALLGASTPKAAKQLETIGLSSIKVADVMKNQGLLPALDLLKKKLDESGLSVERQNEILVRAYGGGRSSTTILTLLQNLNMLRDKTTEIQRKGTPQAFHERWLAQMATAEYQFARLRAIADVTKIRLGDALLPGVVKATSALSDWLGKADTQRRLQHDMAVGFRDAGEAAHVFGEAVHGIGDAFHFLDGVIPGNLLKQLLEVFLLFKAARFAGKFNQAFLNPMKAFTGVTKDAVTQLRQLQVEATRGFGSSNAAIDQLAAGRGLAGYGRPRSVPVNPFPVSGGSPEASLAADEQAQIRAQAAAEMPLVWQRYAREKELTAERAAAKAEAAAAKQAEKDLSQAKAAETKQNNEDAKLLNSRKNLAKAQGRPTGTVIGGGVLGGGTSIIQIQQAQEKEAVTAQDAATAETDLADARDAGATQATETVSTSEDIVGAHEDEAASARDAAAAETELADARAAAAAASGGFSAAQIKQAQSLMLATGTTGQAMLQSRMGLSKPEAAALREQLMGSEWWGQNADVVMARQGFQKKIGAAIKSSWEQGNIPVGITRSGKQVKINPFAPVGENLRLMGGGTIPAEDIFQVQGGEYVLYDAKNTPREGLLTQARQARLAGGSASALDVAQLETHDPLLTQAAISQVAYGGASIQSLQKGLGLSYAKAQEQMAILHKRGVVTKTANGGYELAPAYNVSSIPKYAQIENYAKQGGLLTPGAISSTFGITDAEAQLALQQMQLRGVIRENPNAGMLLPSAKAQAGFKEMVQGGYTPEEARRMVVKAYGPQAFTRAAAYQVVEGSDLIPDQRVAEARLAERTRQSVIDRLIKGGMSPEDARAQALYAENVLAHNRVSGRVPATSTRIGSTLPAYPRPLSYADAEKRAQASNRAVQSAQERVAAAERMAAMAPPMPVMPTATGPAAQAAIERLMASEGISKTAATRIIRGAYGGKVTSDQLVARQLQLKQQMEQLWTDAKGNLTPQEEAQMRKLDLAHREAGLMLNEREAMQHAYGVAERAATAPGENLTREQARLARLTQIRDRRFAAAESLIAPQIAAAQPRPRSSLRPQPAAHEAEQATKDAIQARKIADKANQKALEREAKATELRAKAEETGSKLVDKQNQIIQGAAARQKADEDKLSRSARRKMGVPTPAQLNMWDKQEKALAKTAEQQDRAATKAEKSAAAFRDQATALQTSAKEAEGYAGAAIKAQQEEQQLAETEAKQAAETQAVAEANAKARAELVASTEAGLKQQVNAERLTAAQQKLREEMQLATQAAAKFAETEVQTAQKVVDLNEALTIQSADAKSAARGITEADDATRRLTADEIAAGQAARQEGRVLGATPLSPYSPNSAAIQQAYDEGRIGVRPAFSGGASQSRLQGVGRFGFLPWLSPKEGGIAGGKGPVETYIRGLMDQGMSRRQAFMKWLGGGIPISSGEFMPPEVVASEEAQMSRFAMMRARLGAFGGRFGNMGMNGAMGGGMLLSMFGGQVPGIGGMLSGAGMGMMFAPMLSESAMAGPVGALIGGSFGARSLIRSHIHGAAGSYLGAAGQGAMLGAAAGLMGGPLAELTVPMGAGIGAAAGAALHGLMGLFHSTDETSKKLLGLADAANHAARSAAGAHSAFLASSQAVANDKYAVDQAKHERDAAKAAYEHAKGTNKAKEALDAYNAAQQNYLAAVRQVTTDEKARTNAQNQEARLTKQQRQHETELAKGIADVAKGYQHMVTPMGRFGTMAATQQQKVAAYASRMDDLGNKAQHTNPKLARTYHQLAEIARETNKLPKNIHYIRVVLKLGVEGTKAFKQGMALVRKSMAQQFPLLFGGKGGGVWGAITGGDRIHYDAHTGKWVDSDGKPIANQQAAWDEWLKKHGMRKPQGGNQEPTPPGANRRPGSGSTSRGPRGQGYVDPASSQRLQQLQSQIDQIQAGLMHGNVKKLEQEELAWLRQDYKRARTSAERDAIAQAISQIQSQMAAQTRNAISNGGIGLIPQKLQDRYNKAYQAGNKPAELAALEAEKRYLQRLAARTHGAEHHKAEQLLNVIVGKIDRLIGVSSSSLIPIKDQLAVQKAIHNLYRTQHSGHGNVAALEKRRDLLLEYLKESGHSRKQREQAIKELKKVQAAIRQAKSKGGGEADAYAAVIKALQKEARDLDRIAHDRHRSLKQREQALKEENAIDAQIRAYQKKAYGTAGADFLTTPAQMKKWLKLQDAVYKAQRTPGKKDDIAAYQAEEAFLKQVMDTLHGKAKTEAEKLLTSIDGKLQKLIGLSQDQLKTLEQTYLSDQAMFFAQYGSNVFTGQPGAYNPGSQGAGSGAGGPTTGGSTPPPGHPPTAMAGRNGGTQVTVNQYFPPGTEDAADRHATYARVAAQNQFG